MSWRSSASSARPMSRWAARPAHPGVDMREFIASCSGGPQLRTVDHDLGDDLIGTGPFVGELRLPGRTGDLGHRLQQRGADQRVVLGTYAVAGVPGAEISEERCDRRQVAQ